MDLAEALRTNPSIRDFTDEPVDDATVAELLELARFAPSGGNRQPWHVAVVGDRALRRRLADLCGPVWSEYVAERMAGVAPFRRLPMNVVLLCLSGLVGSLVSRGTAYPGRFTVHLIPVAVTLTMCALALFARGAKRAAESAASSGSAALR